MKVTVTPSAIRGEISAIGSKSAAHRALLAAALVGNVPCLLSGVTLSEDVLATIDCLAALGAKVEKTGKGLLVFPIEKSRLPQTAVLRVRESGSTYRFFLPVVAALGVEAEFIGSDRLFARPSGALFSALMRCGVTVSDGGRKISGNMTLPDIPGVSVRRRSDGNDEGKTGDSDRRKTGRIEIDASESSQYVTGQLFALAVLGGGRLKLTGKRVSTGYIDLTVQILRDFGVDIAETQEGYTVGAHNSYMTPRGAAGEQNVVKTGAASGQNFLAPKESGQNFDTPQTYAVEGDWSNAAFFLAAGALSGDVTVKNLRLNSLQKDRAIVEILRRAGAEVAVSENAVRVKKSRLSAFCADAEEIPDAVPILSVLAAFAAGESVISGVSRLKGKESDRLSGVIAMLRLAGISAATDGAVLRVTGGQPQGNVFLAENDHRMAMSQAVLGSAAAGRTVIAGAECVKKSYPAFFEDFALLGCNVKKTDE